MGIGVEACRERVVLGDLEKESGEPDEGEEERGCDGEGGAGLFEEEDCCERFEEHGGADGEGGEGHVGLLVVLVIGWANFGH